MKKISVVIPMYRSEKTIEFVVNELQQVLTTQLNSFEYEIILVNDCGPDNVLQVAMKLAKQDEHIKLVELVKNSGQVVAIKAGFSIASGDYIVNMDDDGQHPAKYLPQMIKDLEQNNYDVVFAQYPEKKLTPFRKIGSGTHQFILNVLGGKPKNITTNSFFVLKNIIGKSLFEYKHQNLNIYALIFAVTSNVGNTLVEHRPRYEGKSNQSFSALFNMLVNILFGFSTKPLSFVIGFGFITSAVAFIYGAYIFLSVIINNMLGVVTDARGWTSIMVAIVFFAGIQITAIGFIGKYIEQIYNTQSNVPQYTIKNIYNFPKK